MNILEILSSFFLGTFFGIVIYKWFVKLSDKVERDKLIKDVNLQYKEILKNLMNKKTKFKTRVNNTVYLGTKLQDYGKVEIIYLIDRKDLVVFKNDKCILTSELVSKDLVSEISEKINDVYHEKINDIVDILGMVFSREDFEKSFNINIKELKEKSIKLMNEMKDVSDIEKIVQNNNKKFDIDEILDKISELGIESLTKEEKEFLDNYNNKQ